MNKRNAFIFLASIFLVLFLVILFQVVSGGYLIHFDQNVNAQMVLVQTPFFVGSFTLLGILTDSLLVLIFALILAFFLYKKNYKKDSIIFIVFLLINIISFYFLKIITAIPRPLNHLISETDFAFPSGHTTTAFFLFGFLFYLSYNYLKDPLRKISQLIFIIFPFIIGFSRIYLNGHWFSDVLGGLFLGLFWLFSSLAIKTAIGKD
jgi:undecaprenyl-diphosphatase